MSNASSTLQPIALLLVDDHPLVREGLRARLEAEPHFQVVAEAGTAEEALRLAAEHRPAVLLADIRLAGMSGLELAAACRRQLPQTAVVLLSMHDDLHCVGQALSAGACAHVPKHAPAERLVAAIEAAAAASAPASAQARAQANA